MPITKNIILLLLAQGISGAVVSLLTFSSALAGQWLRNGAFSTSATFCQACTDKSPLFNLSTLPVSATLCGAFIALACSSFVISTLGRKRSFLLASFIGMLGAAVGVYALMLGSFWLFSIATFLLGFFTALNGLYRFLAQEALHTANQNLHHKATAFIVGGGILGGILGPNLAHIGLNMTSTPFVGSFIFALLLCVINFLLTLPLSLAPLQVSQKHKAPLIECLKEPHFILATSSCAFGFALMTLVMNAAPLAMSTAHFSTIDSKNVLVWHFIAMYAPSLFLAMLLKNLNPLRLIVLGMVLYAISGVVAIVWQGFWGFWISLFLVGVAWSFSFNGGTFLLNTINTRNKIHLQGLNATTTFGANLLASISVGGILASGGWITLNVIVLIAVVVFLGGFLLFYMRQR